MVAMFANGPLNVQTSVEIKVLSISRHSIEVKLKLIPLTLLKLSRIRMKIGLIAMLIEARK